MDMEKTLCEHEDRIIDLEKGKLEHDLVITAMGDNVKGLRDDLRVFVDRVITAIYWALGTFVTVALFTLGFILS